MRKRNGRYYHREKTSMGKVFWMEMSAAEVIEHDLYWLTVCLMPIICIAVWAWAAGIL